MSIISTRTIGQFSVETMRGKLAPAAIEKRAETVKTLDGSVLVLSSVLTYNVFFASAAIGKDGLYPKSENYADAIGVSPSHVTRLKRLGRAIVLHGVNPESQQWSELSRVVNDAEAVRVLCDMEPGSENYPSDWSAALDKAMADHKAKVSNKGKTVVTPDGEIVEKGSAKDTGDPQSPENKTKPNGDLFSVLYDRLSSLSTPEQFDDFVSKAQALLEAATTAAAEFAAGNATPPVVKRTRKTKSA